MGEKGMGEKIIVLTNTARGKAECCIGLETNARVLFFSFCISALTGLKHFWWTNRLLLAILNWLHT